MSLLKKLRWILVVVLVVSCAKDETPTIPDSESESDSRTVLTATELEFLKAYEYITFNLSPTSFGADVNEKWALDIKLFLDGEISSAYRSSVSQALEQFNALIGNQINFELVDTFDASNVHLIFGEKSAIETVWPDMFDAIGDVNFEGYALYNSNQNYNMTRGRIWVKDPSIPLFNHELGHIIGLGHASGTYCRGDSAQNESFMCSFLKENFSTFDAAIIQTLYVPEIEAGKTFAELKPRIETLLLSGSITVE